MTRDGIFRTSRGHELGWTLHGAELSSDAPVVVYLHGFKGFKDWGFVPELGARMAQAGMRVLAMNFSHNGIGPVRDAFTELDKFKENTFSLEVSEACEVLEHLQAGKIADVEAGVPIGLIGHSRGGGIALLAAARLPMLKAVCTWASVCTYARYPDHILRQWEEDGVLPVVNSRTKQVLHVGWNLHRDLLENGDGPLNIQKAVEGLDIPLCIIHGTEDDAVPVFDSESILEWARPGLAQMHLIKGANHAFGAQHPFQQSTPELEQALAHTMEIFQKNLFD